MFLGNCPPTPPLSQHYTYFSLRAKCWLRGGVGGQFVAVEQTFGTLDYVYSKYR